MSRDMKQYDVEINGMQTTVKLTADDAKKRGLTDKNLHQVKAKGRAAANKAAAAPANKAGAADDDKGDDKGSEPVGSSRGVVVKPADKS
jgi:ribosomal protein L12E/L44/L45/RPP1/RPP2